MVWSFPLSPMSPSFRLGYITIPVESPTPNLRIAGLACGISSAFNVTGHNCGFCCRTRVRGLEYGNVCMSLWSLLRKLATRSGYPSRMRKHCDFISKNDQVKGQT
jgi:hypothetical protein